MSLATPQTDAQLWSSRLLRIWVRGPDGARCIRPGKPFALIGADPRADVVLTASQMPACGIYLHATEQGIYCLGLQPPPGGRSAPRGWLGAKLGVQFGPYRIKAEFDDVGPPPTDCQSDPTEASADGAQPRLKIVCPGPRQVEDCPLIVKSLTLVGASVTDGLLIKDASLSDVHCALYCDGANLWIVDLLSATGVLVEGENVSAAKLLPGQRVSLGAVSFSHQLADNAWPHGSDGGSHGSACLNPADFAVQARRLPAAHSTDCQPLALSADVHAQQTAPARPRQRQVTCLTGEDSASQAPLFSQDRHEHDERLAAEREIAARLIAKPDAWEQALVQLSARIEALEQGRDRLEEQLRRQTEMATALAAELARLRSSQTPARSSTTHGLRPCDAPASEAMAHLPSARLPEAIVSSATRSQGRLLPSTVSESAGLAKKTTTAVARLDLLSGALPVGSEADQTDPLLGQLIQYQARESSFNRRRKLVRASLGSLFAVTAAAAVVALIVWSDALFDRFGDTANAPVGSLSDISTRSFLDEDVALEEATPSSDRLMSKDPLAPVPATTQGFRAEHSAATDIQN